MELVEVDHASLRIEPCVNQAPQARRHGLKPSGAGAVRRRAHHMIHLTVQGMHALSEIKDEREYQRTPTGAHESDTNENARSPTTRAPARGDNLPDAHVPVELVLNARREPELLRLLLAPDVRGPVPEGKSSQLGGAEQEWPAHASARQRTCQQAARCIRCATSATHRARSRRGARRSAEATSATTTAAPAATSSSVAVRNCRRASRPAPTVMPWPACV